MTKYSPWFNRLVQHVRTVARERKFFICNVTVPGSLCLLGYLCLTLNRLFKWDAVGKFGEGCLVVGILYIIVFGGLLHVLLKRKEGRDEAKEQSRMKEAVLNMSRKI